MSQDPRVKAGSYRAYKYADGKQYTLFRENKSQKSVILGLAQLIVQFLDLVALHYWDLAGKTEQEACDWLDANGVQEETRIRSPGSMVTVNRAYDLAVASWNQTYRDKQRADAAVVKELIERKLSRCVQVVR